jgi:class 3 adenylate cyclase
MTTRRIAAILVADVVGYSRLIERDEARVLSTMRSLRTQVLEPLLAQYQGRIVKLMGDGALIEFSSVVDAVQCAVAIQREVGSHQASTPPDRRVVFRIGINLGDVVVEGHDLLGDGVNIAARLEQLCEPGGILVSGTAYDQLHGKVDVGFQFVGEQKVKNIERKVRAYRVNLSGAVPVPRSARPQLWIAGAAAGVVLVVALTAGLGFWLLGSEDELFPTEPSNVDPLQELLAEEAPAPQVQQQAIDATPPPAAPPAVPANTPVQPPAPVQPALPATLPVQQEIGPAEPPRVAELKSYISGYDGGACFFASPQDVTPQSASIEAFASSIPAVQTLDETFRAANGFEAQIGLRQVTPAQCAAIDFLRGASTEVTLDMQVGSQTVQAGQTLTGSLSNAGDRSAAILLVADDGTVHDISDTIRRSSGGLSFEVSLNSSGASEVKPLLLMALATDKPLITLAARTLPPASQLFPILAEEARLSGQTIDVAVEYLKLER